MAPFFRLDGQSVYLDIPQSWAEWLGLFALTLILLILAWRWRRYRASFTGKQWALLVGLLLLAPLAALFFGLRFPEELTPPVPGRPATPMAPVVMLLAALPWMLAGGFLGAIPAAGVGIVTGLFTAFWLTHSAFTPLEIALLAVLFAAAVRQHYRTPIYRLLRYPLAAALVISLLYPFLHGLITPFMGDALLVTRLDYTLTTLRSRVLLMGLELLIGGFLAQILALLLPRLWAPAEALEPSPAERSLRTRFLVRLTPLAALLVIALLLATWFSAGQAAREMLRDRMAGAGQVAAQTIPSFLETGQSLIQEIAQDPDLLSNDPEVVALALTKNIRTVAFFDQLSVIDEQNQPIASYPTSYFIGTQAPAQEQTATSLAFNGAPFHIISVQPAEDQTTAQISFVNAIMNSEGRTMRVLVGRSNLANNMFTQPILASLNSVAENQGQGMLLDEDQVILVHSDPERVMQKYDGQVSDQPLFYDGIAWDGSRQIVYYQPAKGRSWAVVLTVPAQQAQTIALEIALPLLAMILLVSALTWMFIRLSLNIVTSSLQRLAGDAGRLAEGRLDQPVTVGSVDEVGQLGRAFEQMRQSLKARLDELNRLLLVSQGVASSLEVTEAIQPVLEAAVAGGGSARVILTGSTKAGLDGNSITPLGIGAGPDHLSYRYLDEQILALTRQQDRLVLSNINRPRLLNLTPGAPRPESLIAVALKHENQYYGALWLAYEQAHIFSEEEVRFLATLGGYAALAAANSSLFMNAELGRRRVESILASSPDPVLVTDQRDQLLLANPAAWQVLGLGMDTDEGKPIDQVISQPELVDLLRTTGPEKDSLEVTLADDKVYLATATPVLADGQRMGRVCIMRDVTHFKELDALKSEFVSTVSHDLRSPLTLMRGYATMLEMVGQLNEQQVSYVRKIVGGVESMSRLVTNLLNLGRIEAGVGLQLEMISVQDIVERVVGGLQLSAAQKHIDLSVEMPKQNLPLIEADPALLQQALQNLVENAIKYTRAEGKVLLRVLVQPIGLVFQVIDNGPGISPVDMPRLFEKFYRGGQQGPPDARGTGLGLAIVKSIAERHGGRAWAESQLGKGSTFYLALPVRQPKSELVK